MAIIETYVVVVFPFVALGTWQFHQQRLLRVLTQSEHNRTIPVQFSSLLCFQFTNEK